MLRVPRPIERGGQCPGGAVVIEGEIDEAAQVDSG
jgi:hypothetical protein